MLIAFWRCFFDWCSRSDVIITTNSRHQVNNTYAGVSTADVILVIFDRFSRISHHF